MSNGFNPHTIGPVTPALNTGVTSIKMRTTKSPRVDGVREAFHATFGAYLPPDWTLDAECTQPGTDPEVFYPTRGGKQADQAALAICSACTVREDCLEDAIAYETGTIAAEEIRPEVHGVRGGMLPSDRRKLIQRRNVEAQGGVKAAVVIDYVNTQMTVEEIATKHDVAKSSVTRWAKAAGHQPRPRTGGRRKAEPEAEQNGSAA